MCQNATEMVSHVITEHSIKLPVRRIEKMEKNLRQFQKAAV